MVWVCVRYVTYTTNVSNYSEVKELLDKLILNMYCIVIRQQNQW